MPTVLIVDDEPNIRRMVGALLGAEGYEVREAADGRAGLASATDSEPDVALVDLMMPGDMDGIATLTALRERCPNLPVVMMSGKAGLSDAVRATRLGAFTFLEKPLSPEVVMLALASALELREAKREAASLRADLGLTGEMVGMSEAMQELRALIARVGPTDSRVLITGESGTGKELVAAAVHQASARRDRAFIRVNCAAIPRDLVESEMFGHERGAFTGAVERRIGKFELAHRGTLLLDEVGDLGQEAQAKLLRAIEAGEVERVGGGKPIPVDTRLIAATNKDLQRASRDGAFREDLYFRLNVIPIALPPLRERASDLPLLVRHFSALTRVRTGRVLPEWGDDALLLMQRYRWPGNVRELANIVERLIILHPGQRIAAEDVRRVIAIAETPDSVRAVPASSETFDAPLSDLLDDYERLLITRALAAAGGNVAEAARRLQTDRPNLYRRMKRLEIAPESASAHTG
ncbi:MAG: sigma-54-dependent Fis family transcriptional regulator [Gemmatimonadaceae bacterium]|nr:sigma-54-dependent Fis family transcriptional regulator [Gemmatimonadaceae bacterium]